MQERNVIWLASYPRSGNTLLRTILWQCFRLRSASIYPNDLGNNKELESFVGHMEHKENGQIEFPADSIPLIKTHELPVDGNPAIYVVRDGRAASVSLWQFFNDKQPLENVIVGKHRFGTWSDHLAAWEPWVRPYTLLIKYEEMTTNLPHILRELSRFLTRKIVANQLPKRDSLASVDGEWVRKKSNWKSTINDEALQLFNRTNGKMMRKMGYSS